MHENCNKRQRLVILLIHFEGTVSRDFEVFNSHKEEIMIILDELMTQSVMLTCYCWSLGAAGPELELSQFSVSYVGHDYRFPCHHHHRHRWQRQLVQSAHPSQAEEHEDWNKNKINKIQGCTVDPDLQSFSLLDPDQHSKCWSGRKYFKEKN